MNGRVGPRCSPFPHHVYRRISHPMPVVQWVVMSDQVVSCTPHPEVRGAFIEKMASGIERFAPMRPGSRADRGVMQYLYGTAGCRPSTARRLTRHSLRDHGYAPPELPGLVGALATARPRERHSRSGVRTASSRAAPSADPHISGRSCLPAWGAA
jgi:hypothetical protein